jgi:uncharacterized repeat protein (TIGR01451 family)
MRSSSAVTTVLAILLLAAGVAWAQETALITLRSEVLREVEVQNEQGEKETRLVPAPRAMPGDVLVFRINYTNGGSEPARDVQLTNPVPEQMVYEGGSATGDKTAIYFSVDGGQTFAEPGSLTVIGEDGKPKPAQPADYTHIRWQIDGSVPPGGGGTVSFKARLK